MLTSNPLQKEMFREYVTHIDNSSSTVCVTYSLYYTLGRAVQTCADSWLLYNARPLYIAIAWLLWDVITSIIATHERVALTR